MKDANLNDWLSGEVISTILKDTPYSNRSTTDCLVTPEATPKSLQGCRPPNYHHQKIFSTQKSRGAYSTEEMMVVINQFVRSLPPGTQFTSQRLFNGIPMSGDKRNRGHIIRALRKGGLIQCVGLTTDDQESRNSGYAALWEVRGW